MGASYCDGHARYTRGCPPCQARAAVYRGVRRRALGRGDWDRGLVRGEGYDRVLRHIQRLLAHPDVSQRSLARVAGVHHKVLEGLSQGVTRALSPTSADALLGTTLAMCLRRVGGPNTLVSIAGSERRLQALMVDCWSSGDLAALLPIEVSLIRRHRGGGTRRKRLTVRHRDAYRDLYDKIQMMKDPRGPSPQAGTKARRLGYLPPERWADEDIDDPYAQPLPPEPDTDDWVEDSQQVARVLLSPAPGVAAGLPRALQREIAKQALAMEHPWSWEQIARVMGFKSASSAEYLVHGRPDRPAVKRERAR